MRVDEWMGWVTCGVGVVSGEVDGGSVHGWSMQKMKYATVHVMTAGRVAWRKWKAGWTYTW